MSDKRLNNEMIECIAERFRTLGDTSRIRILLRLRDGAANVTELAREVGISASSVSKHLSQLKHVGLVQSQREGTQTLYSVRDVQIFDLCETVCGDIRRHHASMHAALNSKE